MSDEGPRVRWFAPDKPENISVGRQRIATHLQNYGFSVDLSGTTVGIVRHALRVREQYDVVIGTTRAGAIAGTAVGCITGKPVIVDHVDPIRQLRETHSWPIAWFVQVTEDFAFTLADTVMYVYEGECARVSRYATETVKTNLGVEYERFANPNPEIVESARDRLDDLSIRDKVAIYVGGLEPIYHIEELLAAMANLPDWSLVMIGDGSLRDAVGDAAAKHETVLYLGTVPHEAVPGYLRAADVGISLVDDPYTLKVLEYGAAGLPVVQAAGRAEDRFGSMVEYCDPIPVEIADAIHRAGDQGRNGELKSFAADFDWEEIADDYREAITIVT